jgi:hypothetical protein
MARHQFFLKVPPVIEGDGIGTTPIEQLHGPQTGIVVNSDTLENA